MFLSSRNCFVGIAKKIYSEEKSTAIFYEINVTYSHCYLCKRKKFRRFRRTENERFSDISFSRLLIVNNYVKINFCCRISLKIRNSCETICPSMSLKSSGYILYTLISKINLNYKTNVCLSVR